MNYGNFPRTGYTEVCEVICEKLSKFLEIYDFNSILKSNTKNKQFIAWSLSTNVKYNSYYFCNKSGRKYYPSNALEITKTIHELW